MFYKWLKPNIQWDLMGFSAFLGFWYTLYKYYFNNFFLIRI